MLLQLKLHQLWCKILFSTYLHQDCKHIQLLRHQLDQLGPGANLNFDSDSSYFGLKGGENQIDRHFDRILKEELEASKGIVHNEIKEMVGEEFQLAIGKTSIDDICLLRI